MDIGRTDLLIYAAPMTGRKYICGSRGNITLEKQWSPHSFPYALQATVKDIAVHDSSFMQYRTLDELFPVETKVFMLGSPHYGCMGEVSHLIIMFSKSRAVYLTHMPWIIFVYIKKGTVDEDDVIFHLVMNGFSWENP